MSAPDASLMRLLGAVLAVGVALGLPAQTAQARDAAANKAAWPGDNDYETSVRSYAVPDVVLIDADGRPVRLRELLAGGDPLMVNFIFTTCGTICPVMVKVFADVPSRLGEAAATLRLVSISIDPDNDTPAKLKSYAKAMGAGPRWQFLTGRLQDIQKVQMAFDGYRGDKMNHMPLTLIRPAAGKAWLRIDGFANPDELAREYRTAASK